MSALFSKSKYCNFSGLNLKGVEIQQIPSYADFMCFSNQDKPIRMHNDSRRELVLEPTEIIPDVPTIQDITWADTLAQYENKKKKAYFRSLSNAIKENPTAQYNIYHFFMNENIEHFRPQDDMPSTQAKTELKINCLPSSLRHILALTIGEGGSSNNVHFDTAIPTDVLYENYLSYCESEHIFPPLSKIEYRKNISLLKFKPTEIVRDKKRYRGLHIPVPIDIELAFKEYR